VRREGDPHTEVPTRRAAMWIADEQLVLAAQRHGRGELPHGDLGHLLRVRWTAEGEEEETDRDAGRTRHGTPSAGAHPQRARDKMDYRRCETLLQHAAAM